jgi:Fic family protein
MRGRFEERIWQHDPSVYAPPRHRRACRYEVFVPDSLGADDVPLAPSTVAAVSEAERRLQLLGPRNDGTGGALTPFSRLLLRTESIASSRVEGLQVDARALARAEVRTDTDRRPAASTTEVLANITAMEVAIGRATDAQSFGVDDVLAIHRELLVGGPHHRIAGVLRDGQNWIGGNDHTPCGADFVPPPPDELPALMDDLVAAVAGDGLPPLVQAALVHAQFETVHPFADGNGRTGRALIHVVLRRRGLTPTFVPPISVAFSRARERYIRGLVAYRDGDVDGWIETFATAAITACDLTDSYLREVDTLVSRWRELLGAASAPRSDAAAWRLIELLPAHPVITAAVAQAATGRARAAVHNAIEQLIAAEVLIPLSGARRNRAWEPAGLVDLIARVEDGVLGTA